MKLISKSVTGLTRFPLSQRIQYKIPLAKESLFHWRAGHLDSVYGPTSFASKKPIRTLADFKGKKIRVLATKMESTLVGKFGAAGVPIPYTEVLPALQRGTIDAVRSSIIVMGGSKFFTVIKSITVVESGMIPSAVTGNEPGYSGSGVIRVA